MSIASKPEGKQRLNSNGLHSLTMKTSSNELCRQDEKYQLERSELKVLLLIFEYEAR